jgi:hypothetical protein
MEHGRQSSNSARNTIHHCTEERVTLFNYASDAEVAVGEVAVVAVVDVVAVANV